MKLVSSSVGEWPTGTHWTPGEVRDIAVAKDAEVPGWLQPAKSKKSSKPTKAEG